jgi:predicted Zn-dependent protease
VSALSSKRVTSAWLRGGYARPGWPAVLAYRPDPPDEEHPYSWTVPMRAKPRVAVARGDTAAINHATQAGVLYGMRRYGEAADHARAALAAEPGNSGLHALLATCLSGLGRNVEAERAAADAIRLAPNEPDGYKVMAAVLLAGDQPARAERAIVPALRLAATDPDGFALLANACGRQRDWRGR